MVFVSAYLLRVRFAGVVTLITGAKNGRETLSMITLAKIGKERLLAIKSTSKGLPFFNGNMTWM